MNKRTKAMFDIVPAKVSSDFKSAEEIDLHEQAEPQTDQTKVQTEVEPLSGGVDKSVQSVQGFDDLLSNITKKKIPSHEELTAMMEQANDPIVELASMGAEFSGDFRPILTNAIFQPVDPKKEEDELHRRIIDKIKEPLISRVAHLTSSYKPEIKLDQAVSGGKYYGLEEKVKVKELAPVLGFIKEEKVISNIETRVADFYLPTQTDNKPNANIVKNIFAKMPLVTEESALSKQVLNPKPNVFNFSPVKKRKIPYKWIIIVSILGLVAYGLTLKNELVRESFSALDNLQQAQESLKNYNFSDAAKNFSDSYEDFTKASQNLNMMGAGLAGIFGDLPGVSKLKSAKDIVEAGKLLAGAGQAMSEAVSSLSQTGSILNPADKNKTKPSKIVRQIKDALQLSDKNFQKAKILLASIDESVIPEDKRSGFHDFKDKIPLFEQYLGDAIEYADFLEGIVGIDEPKKYLFLFENNSELRPTGGFPGTYGVVSFASGGLADFFVNDVYNLDGQLKKNIIPPKQIQHITPNWGMRDSAWFTDFPTSAKKAMWFFEQEAGYGVDGVITINPDIVSAILGIVGPIELSSYDMTLTEDNFVESIQEEVEYGPNRTQPKQVVADFAPLFLEKLYSADSEKWMKIFNVLMTGLDEKDILFYFNEKYLEEFSIKKGYGGEVRETDTDYMMVTFSNIKGSKTDVVTDSSIDIESRIEDGRMIHKVILSRQHKGGDQEHGFYNRQNPAYVRMLLPEDSELISISGNDNPNFRPLVNYNSQPDFEYDVDLKKYESGFYFDKTLGVDKFEESNKKGIGFWMITDPGTTKTVEFEYSVPLKTDYSFYFQKQPGLDWKDFKLSIQEPKDYNIVSSSLLLNRIGDLYMLDKELKEDLELTLSFDIDK